MNSTDQVWLQIGTSIGPLIGLVIWVVKRQGQDLARVAKTYSDLVKDRFEKGDELARIHADSNQKLSTSLDRLSDTVSNNNQIIANCENVVMEQTKRRMQTAHARGEPLSQ